jgi:hypothetical protein
VINGSSNYNGIKKPNASFILLFLIKYSVIFYTIKLDPYLALSSNSPNLSSLALNRLEATSIKSLYSSVLSISYTTLKQGQAFGSKVLNKLLINT